MRRWSMDSGYDDQEFAPGVGNHRIRVVRLAITVVWAVAVWLSCLWWFDATPQWW